MEAGTAGVADPELEVVPELQSDTRREAASISLAEAIRPLLLDVSIAGLVSALVSVEFSPDLLCSDR